MIISSIKNIWLRTSQYTEQTHYTTLVDPRTQKEYIEPIVYRVYNRRAELVEHTEPKLDLRA